MYNVGCTFLFGNAKITQSTILRVGHVSHVTFYSATGDLKGSSAVIYRTAYFVNKVVIIFRDLVQIKMNGITDLCIFAYIGTR